MISAALNLPPYHNCEYLLSPHSTPGMLLGALPALTHLPFTTKLFLSPLYRFRNRGTERWNYVPESHSLEAVLLIARHHSLLLRGLLYENTVISHLFSYLRAVAYFCRHASTLVSQGLGAVVLSCLVPTSSLWVDVCIISLYKWGS